MAPSMRMGCLLGWLVAWIQPAHAESFECMIMPSETLELGSPVEGTLEKVPVERGDVIRRGQVVATLVSSVEAAAAELARARAERTVDVEFAESQLRLAQKRRQRAGELVKKDFVSTDDLDKARTEEELATIAVKKARDDRRLYALEHRQSAALLQQKTIQSPIDGVVVERMVGPGERVESQPLVRVAKINPLHVEAILPVRMLGRVRLGDRVQVVPEHPAGQQFSATVTVVDRVVDGASGTFGIRAELSNPELRIHAGLSCQLKLPAAVRSAAAPGS